MLLNNTIEIINSARLQLGELAYSITKNQQEGNNNTPEQKVLQARLMWTYTIINVLDPIISIEDDQVSSILGDYDDEKLNRMLLALRVMSGASRMPLLPGILNPIGQKVSTGTAGTQGTNGQDAYVYIGYADDASGTGYSTSPAGKNFIAIKNSNVPLVVGAGTFTGLWKQYVGAAGAAGAAGADGESNYIFQAWADSSTGTGFTLTFSSSKAYTAFLIKDNNNVPVVGDFTGLWTKYKGDAGAAGVNGVNGKTLLSGVGEPDAALGVDGDYYIDTADGDRMLYGPKTVGAWGAPLDLKGDPGDEGAAGADGDPGADGADSYLYIAYADSADGTGFTTVFDPTKEWIAIKQSATEILSPVVGDFTGLWSHYRGEGGDRYKTTSTTLLDVLTGTKHLIIEKDLAYSTGQRALIALNNDPSVRMEGLVVAYDPGTGQLTLDVDTVFGSGTYSVWDVNLTGAPVAIASQQAFYATLGSDQGSGGATQALSTTPAKIDAFDTVVSQSAGMSASTADDKITVQNNGGYAIDFNGTVSGTASADLTFQIYKNGAALPNALARVLLDASGNPQNVSIHFIAESVEQSDYFEVFAVAAAGTPDLLVQQGRFSVYTIGYMNSEQYKNFENLDVDAGTEVVDNFSASLGNAVEFKYMVKKGTAIRGGTIIAVWDGTNPPVHSEVGTISLGLTDDLVLDVDFSGGEIRLMATAASADWIVRGKRTIIG